jgi:type IV pilus assembly protein PilQ
MIESRIVFANKDFAQALGVKFGVGQAAGIGSGKTFAYGGKGTQSGIVAGTTAADGTFTQTSGGTFVPSVTSGGTNTGAYLVDLGLTSLAGHPAGALAMTLARSADYVLNLELSALENENKGEVVANPRVMTSDRVEAFISQGFQVPYAAPSTGNSTTTTINFKQAVLELRVKPQITPNGSIIMDLKIKKDDADTSQINPPITTKQLETSVQVNDGETIVLGGVYETNTGKTNTKVPFFGDLPGVGWLFKSSSVTDAKKELLIFVTPKIVKDSLSTHK